MKFPKILNLKIAEFQPFPPAKPSRLVKELKKLEKLEYQISSLSRTVKIILQFSIFSYSCRQYTFPEYFGIFLNKSFGELTWVIYQCVEIFIVVIFNDVIYRIIFVNNISQPNVHVIFNKFWQIRYLQAQNF